MKSEWKAWLLILLATLFVIGVVVWYIVSYINYQPSGANNNPTIVFSNYPNADFNNINYSATDSSGNKVLGTEWFGVNGNFTKDRPLIFGTNQYTYWVDNSSYYILPQILVPDQYHKNQSVILNATLKKNLLFQLVDEINVVKLTNTSNLMLLRGFDNSGNDSSPLEYAGGFSIRYYPNPQESSQIPFGAVLIFEHNRELRTECPNLMRSTTDTGFYTLDSIDNKYDAYVIPKDFGGNAFCEVIGYPLYNIPSTEMKVSIYPNQAYVLFNQLRIEVENPYLLENLSSPIYENKFNVTLGN